MFHPAKRPSTLLALTSAFALCFVGALGATSPQVCDNPNRAELSSEEQLRSFATQTRRDNPALRRLLQSKGMWHLCDSDHDSQLTAPEWEDCREAAGLYMQWNSIDPKSVDTNSDRMMSWEEICARYPAEVCHLARTKCGNASGVPVADWGECQSVVQWHRAVDERRAAESSTHWAMLLSIFGAFLSTGVSAAIGVWALRQERRLHDGQMADAQSKHLEAFRLQQKLADEAAEQERQLHQVQMEDAAHRHEKTEIKADDRHRTAEMNANDRQRASIQHDARLHQQQQKTNKTGNMLQTGSMVGGVIARGAAAMGGVPLPF